MRWTDAWHNQGAAAEADTVGDQQPNRTRSGAAAEADASGEQQLKREQQLEAEANGEQQLKRMPQSGLGAAAEADAIGEQPCTESCPAPDYAR